MRALSLSSIFQFFSKEIMPSHHDVDDDDDDDVDDDDVTITATVPAGALDDDDDDDDVSAVVTATDQVIVSTLRDGKGLKIDFKAFVLYRI